MTEIRPAPATDEKSPATSWGGGEQPSYAVSGYWTPKRMRGALDANDAGCFASIVSLRCYLTRDARVGGQGGARGQRISAPMGLEAELEPAKGYERSDGRSPAQRVMDAQAPILESGAYGPLVRAHLLGELADFGVGYAALTWQPSPGGGSWDPVLTPWPLDATRVDELTGEVKAVFVDGTEEPITPGDGRWIKIAATLARPWESGAIRSIASAVLQRAYALRDANRFSEAAGQNPVIGTIPRENGGTEEKAEFKTVMTGITEGKQGAIVGEGYKVARLNSKGEQIQIFMSIAGLASSDIAIGYLGTDATLEKGTTGTYGAVGVLDGVRYDLVEADCSALREAWLLISVPHAFYNFARPDLASRLDIDVPDPEEEAQEKAEHDETRAARKAFHEELASLRLAGVVLTAELVSEVAQEHDVEVSTDMARAIAEANGPRQPRNPDLPSPDENIS